MITITRDDAVGSIAAQYPLSTRVFSRHQIDFCCGGGIPLREVCGKNGLNAEELIEEIHKELEDKQENEAQWDKATLESLIEHLLEKYHKPLYQELSRLTEMASKVYQVHREKDPETLKELFSTVRFLQEELTGHMGKEEQILFPMIRQGIGYLAIGPINVMNMEHESTGEMLKKIRELTNNFKVPEEACNTWRALWHGLEALERDLHLHIHLENNILFPKVLGR